MSLNETITQVCNQITAQDFLTVSDFYSLKPGNIFKIPDFLAKLIFLV